MALDLPTAPRDAIAGWRDRLVAGHDEFRPVAAESLHVTLCFLGWRPEKEVSLVARTVEDACTGLRAPRLSAAGLEPVPRRLPRLLALDLNDPENRASAVQAAVSEALRAARLFEPEKRPFWPHVTLARVKRGARGVLPEVSPAPPAEPFEAMGVTLYRSTLRPQGALYEPLARTVLGRGGITTRPRPEPD